MPTPTSRLDADELLHLALNASGRHAHGDAIEYLKQALELSPEHAKAHYLLGAEYAQIAMFDRAQTEMEHAVRLAADLHIARFQLGLLHITSGNADHAAEVWRPLDALGDQHPLLQFKRGLLCMAGDDFEGCRSHLTEGILLNHENPALNADMERLLATLPSPSETEAPQTNQIFLSAYTGG